MRIEANAASKGLRVGSLNRALKAFDSIVAKTMHVLFVYPDLSVSLRALGSVRNMKTKLRC